MIENDRFQIADFHNDVLTCKDFSCIPKDYEKYKIVTAIFRGDRKFNQALNLTSKSKYIAFEDIGYDDIDEESIFKIKPIYVGLTWNGENQYGYGCDYSFGLKSKGIEIVRKLSKSKIAVDTAHISKQGFKDIIDNADIVVNSHTCFSGVFKHKRNLENWQIKLLIEKGGLIGLACCGYFMTNRKTCKIDDYISNILYFYEMYGSDNLCVGTDFNGTDFLPLGLENYDEFESLYSLLESRGIPRLDTKKILYQNLSNFLSNK